MEMEVKKEELFRQIFKEEKIVDKIVTYLRFWDICHARESCKLFYRSFSPHLTIILFNEKDVLRNYYTYGYRYEINPSGASGSSGDGDIKSFVEFHQNPDNFSDYKDNPIAYQKFYLNFNLRPSNEDKEDSDIYSSFNKMLKKGKKIKYLRINIEIVQFSIFVDLFEDLVIEELYITLSRELEHMYFQKSKDEEFPSLNLQNVIKLNFRILDHTYLCTEEKTEKGALLAKKIFEACSSDLKELKFFCERFSSLEFNILSSKNSMFMKCLKKIIFHEEDAHDFAEKLKNIKISLISDFFEVEYLKSNEIQSFFDLFKPKNIKNLDDNNLPLFPAVEHLKLERILKNKNKNNELFYINLVQSLKIFPNLKHLGININNSVQEETFKEMADDGKSFPKLKELDIYYFNPRYSHFPITSPSVSDDDNDDNEYQYSNSPDYSDYSDDDDDDDFVEIEGQQEDEEEDLEEEVDNFQPGQEVEENQDQNEEEEEGQPDLGENEGQENEDIQLLDFFEDDAQGLEEDQMNFYENLRTTLIYIEPSDLSKVFPNLIDLKLSGICPRMNFVEIWKNLSKLEHFTYSPDWSYSNFYNYKMRDEDITGIDQEYINQNLKGKSYQELIHIKREDLEFGLGIWNLKKLKTLKLSYLEKHLISEISYFFGFRLLQNLEVLDIYNIEVIPNVRELLLDKNEFVNLKELNSKCPTISKFGIKEIQHKIHCKGFPLPNLLTLTEKDPDIDEKWSEHIFGNVLLLSKIGEFLPLKSALILRRVSKFWYKYIFSNSNQKLSIYFHFGLNKHPKKKEIDLEHFIEFYENSKLPAANAFYSINFDHFSTEPRDSESNVPFERQKECFEKILKMFPVRSLFLRGNGYLRVLSLIQENGVNLEELKVNDWTIWMHNQINQQLNPTLLKSVEKLDLDMSEENVSSFNILIDSCPNIKSLTIQNYSKNILSRLAGKISQGQPGQLKNLKFLKLRRFKSSYTNNDINDRIRHKIIQVAKALELEKIILHHYNLKVKEGLNWTNIEDFLNLILSQDETLNITFPEVTSFSQSEKKIKNFSRIFFHFPNLTKLGLKFADQNDEGEIVDSKFLLEKVNEDEDFSKLEILKYNFHSNFWLIYEERICNYFPNLTQLSIKFMLNELRNPTKNGFKFNLALIYERLPKLTKLSLTPFEYYYLKNKEKLIVSDEEITGIPQIYIEEHLMGKNEEFLKNFDPQNIPENEKKTGIEALKDLTYLKMNFEGLTPISIFLGLRHLTKLKVLKCEHLIINLSSLALIENEFSELEVIDVDFSKVSKKRYSFFKEKCPSIRTSRE